jgi:glyoxylase-like metal-dependent hydrolase (beta-lactamase superfamily II)
VFAAIAIDGGGASCNAGIIDMGDFTVIFDTFQTQKAAISLRSAAEHLLGNSVRFVVNSHCHSDHIRGNQVFGDTTIVSTAKTRQSLIERGQEDIRRDSEEAPRELRALETKRVDMTEQDILLFKGVYQATIESIPSLVLTLPSLSFDRKLILHGAHRTAEIINCGRVHSSDDAILHLPQDGVAFMGDTIFIGYHPWLGDGNPEEFVRALDLFDELGLRILVPGHGSVGSADDIETMRKYITVLQDITSDVLKAGGTEQEAANKRIPPPFDSWKLRSFVPENLRFMYKHLSERNLRK